MDSVQPLEKVLQARGTGERIRMTEWKAEKPWPLSPLSGSPPKKAGT
jgi:hypothetical protein